MIDDRTDRTPGVTIEQIDAAQARTALPALVDLLQDTVNSGATIGFLPLLTEADAHAYWQDIIAAIDASQRLLLVARTDVAIIGAVQLALAQQPNGHHRAEVAKLMVHRRARRRGIGRALLAAVDETARANGRTLLILDTRRGDAGELLYRSHGFVEVGMIPQYARSADGTLHDTVYFYRLLPGVDADSVTGDALAVQD